MTTQTEQTRATADHAAFNGLLRLWDRRLRLQQMVAWLARSLLPGLAVGVGIAIASRLRPWLTNTQVAMIALALVVGGLLLLLAVVWLRPRPPLPAARRFDMDFGLKERVSTALELLEGRIRAADDLIHRQLEDAYQQARGINPQEKLPLQARRGEWVAVLALSVILFVLVMLPNTHATALTQNTAQQQAIAQAAEDVRDAIEEVAADSSLTPETRENLLESLQTSLETLQDEDITPEEALATLNDVRQMLESEAGGLQQELEQQQQAAADALEALGEPGESGAGDQRDTEAATEPATSAQAATQQLREALDSAMENVESMSQAEQQELADALEQAAQALQESNPQAAEALQEAADALRQGDTQAAQDALSEANEQLERQQRDQTRQEQGQQQLQQSSQELQQSQQDIQQGDQPQPAESGEQQPGQDSQPQPGDSSGQNEGDTLDADGQPGSSPSDQQGEGEGESGGQGGEDGQESGQPGQQGNQPGQQSSDAGEGASNNPSDQAGTQPGSADGDTTGQAQGIEQEQSGGADGGQRQFEEVFAPRRLGGAEGETDITLQPSSSDEPLREGDLTENPTGDVTVPYNQVFSDYADSANEALDQAYIPLGLRDVVRDYFTSLAPRSSP